MVATEVVRNGVSTSVQAYKMPSGQYMTYFGAGVDAICEGTDQKLLADSAESLGDQKVINLYGHVRYREARMRVTADKMVYWTAEERIVLEGNVDGVTSTGTHFKAPTAVYWRAIPAQRRTAKLDATGRPDIWISPKDAGTKEPKDSVNIKADRVISENDSLVWATGRVEINRPDMLATGDSAYLDNGKETLDLLIHPKVEGRGESKFSLVGDRIFVQSNQRQVQRVKSSGSAVATSDEVKLKADTIDMRVADQKLQRAFAWGPKRAVADAQNRQITADSIDVVMPGQVIREMRAIRDAMADSHPDTTKIISKEMDWLRGDTVVATFEQAAASDTSNAPAIKQIVARGKARSFYQMAPSGATEKTDKPNINYVTGRLITVDFVQKEIQTVTVIDRAAGFYLEALADSTKLKAKAASDSAKAKATTDSAKTKAGKPGAAPAQRKIP